MEKLSDFKPLERVTLPGIGDLNCSGLVLVVGPNSSGKSQFLQDLYHRLCGLPRTLVVAENVHIDKPEYEPFIKCLESEGYFETTYDTSGTKQWRPRTMYLGMGQPVSQIKPNQGQQWHHAYQPSKEKIERKPNEFLNYFGKLLVTALFLERRLVSLSQTNTIDFQEQPPQHDLHALYLDDVAKKRLYDELLESFGKAVWPDISRGSIVCLRVSDEEELPAPEDRLSPKKMSKYRAVETEGDGLKSYVATCVALLLGRRPVCVIDEPEMCLHPPQAHNLGRFLGRYGTSADTATFVATHSSQILRGVIQSGENIQIVRLNRRDGKFSAHLVPADVLAEAVAKPTIRAESVLDGIFSECVVVVEADGDRLVYQTVLETLSNEVRLDVHFAAVGGTGGIADTCKLYRTLDIPIAVIADLDLINDPYRLSRILHELTSPSRSANLCADASTIMDKIKKLPPTISTRELKKGLNSIPKVPCTWNNNDDVAIRQVLVQLSRELDRMRRLKRGGVSAFSKPIRSPLEKLIGKLRPVGLFLVPVGELEEWLAQEGITESKRNKWAWANAAAQAIQTKGSSDGDIWDFVRTVSNHVSKPVASLPSAQENGGK